MYFIELIPTRNCNQKCSYCNIYEENKTIEADLDFLKYVLKCFDTELFVEICGGEPGLITNLDDVHKILYDSKNVHNMRFMSNGLVRLRGFDWLNDVYYREHLIEYIDDRVIKKFYDLDIVPHEKWNYIVVLDEKTANTLLDNYDYFNKMNMFGDHMFYKVIKSTKSFENIKKFYETNNVLYGEETLKRIRFSKNKPNKVLCSINPPYPVIDFKQRRIYHCAIFLKNSKYVDFTEENCIKLMKCELFGYQNYCDKCHVIDYKDKAHEIIKCRKGNYTNIKEECVNEYK